MTTLGNSVAFFGSSVKNPKSKKYYNLAMDLAEKLAKRKLSIITGGSFGIMEAANKGAKKAKGASCGLCIDLPKETPNSFIDKKYELHFRYFFVRKVMFVKYAKAFIVFPGGYGTLDELFEALTLIQTEKIQSFPVYLIGKNYWKPLIEFLQNTAAKKGMLTKEDLSLFKLTDDIDFVVDEIVRHCCKKSLEKENF